jgi:reversibly glycosylated polypeptide/UDP-arabinopyranose mutase
VTPPQSPVSTTPVTRIDRTTTRPSRSAFAIVVPTIRENSILEFLDRWQYEFAECRVIVVEDNPVRSFRLPAWIEHYAWQDIDNALRTDSWIIPRRSDCIRSFGFYLAYWGSHNYVLTLDDDCYPEADYSQAFLVQMRSALDTRWINDRWWNTLGSGIFPRGYPYDIRGSSFDTVIHHGLWSNVPDLDALTQAKLPELRISPANEVSRVPTGRFFPMCGMNLAFRREMIPALYFLLMGRDRLGNSWPYDRFGDIWAGLFAKRIADHLGYSVSSGAPSVHHSRASDTAVNLRKETPGYPINELLWKRVGEIQLTSDTPAGCYREIAMKLAMSGPYWDTLKSAMVIWSNLLAGIQHERRFTKPL